MVEGKRIWTGIDRWTNIRAQGINGKYVVKNLGLSEPSTEPSH